MYHILYMYIHMYIYIYVNIVVHTHRLRISWQPTRPPKTARCLLRCAGLHDFRCGSSGFMELCLKMGVTRPGKPLENHRRMVI